MITPEKAWKKDKRWSDKFLPEMKSICGTYLIGEASLDEDAERNTDLVVLKLDAVRIACRVRKFSYSQKNGYRNQITIRSGRPSGTKTELTKMIEGWGDYMLYGFASEDESGLHAWVLCDLKPLRLFIFRHMASRRNAPPHHYPWQRQKNHDRSSDFVAIDIDDLPAEVVVAISHPWRHESIAS